jgi:hypothetical protein
MTSSKLKKNAKGINNARKSGNLRKMTAKMMSGFKLPDAACSKYPTSLDEKINAVRINKIATKPLKI